MFITVCALVLPINIELSRISRFLKFSGDRTERVTPVPIPNTEVKPLRADGTARATLWETRSLPGLRNPDEPQGLSGFLIVGQVDRIGNGTQKAQVGAQEAQAASVIHDDAFPLQLRCAEIQK